MLEVVSEWICPVCVCVCVCVCVLYDNLDSSLSGANLRDAGSSVGMDLPCVYMHACMHACMHVFMPEILCT